MKKNKMMRAAFALMVITMLTMSIVSGTFAKYVTEGGANDKARVAMFGVTVEGSSDLFAQNYVKTSNVPGSENLTVKSSKSEDVVAPGTQSKADGMKISVKGEPEVAVKVEFSVTAAKDIYLKKANDLPDRTNKAEKFNNDSDYYPVKFTLTKGSTPLVTDGKLSDVKTALEGATVTKEYAAGTNLNTEIGDYVLKWKWDYDDADGNGTYDKQDTLLGDLAAKTVTIDSDLYNLDTEFAVTVKVTQVD